MAGGAPLPPPSCGGWRLARPSRVNIDRRCPVRNDAAKGFQEPFNFTLSENFRMGRFGALPSANTMKSAFEWVASDFTLKRGLDAARPTRDDGL